MTGSPLLILPNSRPERWALLSQFIADWYGSLCAEDSYSSMDLDILEKRIGISLPPALREFYQLAGKRNDIWSVQDTLLPLDQISIENGVLEFYVENQSVTSWGIRAGDLSQEDPPVVFHDANDEWIVQSLHFSEFMLHLAAYTVQFAKGIKQIHGYAQPACVNRLVVGIPELAFPKFLWSESRLLGFRDLIVAIDGTDHATASARTTGALDHFRRFVTEEDFEILYDSEQ